MELTLARHGDAHAGFTGPISGPSGCRGLTELGRRQADDLAARLATSAEPPDVILTSLIPRAIETAAAITDRLGRDPAPRDCDLCEVHTGDADGVDWGEHLAAGRGFDMAAEPDRPFAPRADSWNSFHARVAATMTRLASRYGGRRVLVVGHAGWIAASLRIHLGSSIPTVRLHPTNTGLTVWRHDRQRPDIPWTLVRYDDVEHVRS